VNKFFAIVVPVLCVIGVVVVAKADTGLAQAQETVAKTQVIIPLVVCMVIAPLVLWGTGEVILLLTEIENNTSKLRGMTSEERKAREHAIQLLEERTQAAREREQARHEKAKRKLSLDLHAVLSQTGNRVAVQIELLKPITIDSFAMPLSDLGFELVDNRPGMEYLPGQRAKRLTGYIASERVVDLALSSDVERVSSWQPTG
jgi:hypothetical protein